MKPSIFVLNRRFSVIFIIFILTIRPSFGQTTYYVKAGGNDSNSGLSIAAAVKTIQRAVDLASSGDRIEIKEGTFNETVSISKSDLIVTNYDNGNVFITAFDKIDSWTEYDTDKNIYVADFTPQDFDSTGIGHILKDANGSSTPPGAVTQFLQVFAKKGLLNGQLMKISRFPKIPDPIDSILSPGHYGNKVKIYEDQKFRFYDPIQPESFYQNLDGAIIQAMVGQKLSPVQGKIDGGTNDGVYSLGECLYNNTTKGWQNANYNFLPISNGDRSNKTGLGEGFIINHYNLIEEPGEWYYDKQNKKLYLKSPSVSPPEEVVVKSRTFVFDLNGASNVLLKNLNIKGGAISFVNANNCRIENCNVSYPLSFLPFYEGGSEYTSRAGILIDGNYNRVENSIIENSWGSALAILGTTNLGNTINNNTIRNINWMGGYMAAIEAGGAETSIEYNTLSRSGRFLIFAVGIKRGRIKYNDMYSGMSLGQDGGAFYTCNVDSPAQGDSTEIAYNWVHDLVGSPWFFSPGNPQFDRRGTSGIYLDCASSGFFVHHNVVWNAEKGIQVNRTSKDAMPDFLAKKNYVYHNTCITDPNGDYAIKVNNFDPVYTQNNDSSFVKVFNNLINNDILPSALLRGNLIDTTSLNFASVHFEAGSAAYLPSTSLGFTLASTSPAVDYSQAIDIYVGNTSTLLFDTVGPGPDAGAYERGTPIWTAGANLSKVGVKTTGGSSRFARTNETSAHEGLQQLSAIAIYPNPSTGTIAIRRPDTGSDHFLIVTDSQSRSVFQIAIKKDDQGTLDLSYLKPGLYIWQIIDEKRQVRSTGKLIKK